MSDLSGDVTYIAYQSAACQSKSGDQIWSDHIFILILTYYFNFDKKTNKQKHFLCAVSMDPGGVHTCFAPHNVDVHIAKEPLRSWEKINSPCVQLGRDKEHNRISPDWFFIDLGFHITSCVFCLSKITSISVRKRTLLIGLQICVWLLLCFVPVMIVISEQYFLPFSRQGVPGVWQLCPSCGWKGVGGGVQMLFSPAEVPSNDK